MNNDINNLWRLGWGYLQLHKGVFITQDRQRIVMPAVDSVSICEQRITFVFKRYMHRGETVSFTHMQLFDPQEQFIIESEFKYNDAWDGRRLNNLTLGIRRKDTNHGEARISATSSCLRP